MASYAKQAKDDELFDFAKRIRGRTIERCGELLKQFDGRGGDHGNQYAGSKTAAKGNSAKIQTAPVVNLDTKRQSLDPRGYRGQVSRFIADRRPHLAA